MRRHNSRRLLRQPLGYFSSSTEIDVKGEKAATNGGDQREADGHQKQGKRWWFRWFLVASQLEIETTTGGGFSGKENRAKGEGMRLRDLWL